MGLEIFGCGIYTIMGLFILDSQMKINNLSHKPSMVAKGYNFSIKTKERVYFFNTKEDAEQFKRDER